jgi:hypothetical protein
MSQDTLQQDKSPGDAVDAIVAQWRVERPDLDSSAKHVTGRIVRLASLFLQEFERNKRVLGEPASPRTTSGALAAPPGWEPFD